MLNGVRAESLIRSFGVATPISTNEIRSSSASRACRLLVRVRACSQLADHQDRPGSVDAAVVRGGARDTVGHDRLRPAGLPRPPGVAAPRRLADRPVGRCASALLLLRFFQSRHAEPARRPLERARLHHHALDRAALAADRRKSRLARRRRRPARPRRHRRPGRSAALRLERQAIIWGHVWLLLAGFTWAIAIVHIRRHRWQPRRSTRCPGR